MLDSVPSQHLPDICSAIVKASYTEKIQVLDAIDLSERFKKALPLLMRQIEVSIFMPPKELWEAYSNRTVCPSVRVSVPLSCPVHISYIL